MGTVYLVGAGPGDQKLITIKGHELLKQCDVVIYDRLASPKLLDVLKEDCVQVYVGKESGHHSMSQEEINRTIVTYAKKYNTVVRLKGGDSFVFGRGGEEIEEICKHGIAFEVVPGITSAISVPEIAGIPVTHRGVSQSFHVITGHTKRLNGLTESLPDHFDALAKLDGTLVFLMGLSNIEAIVEQLIFYGKNEQTPVAVISNGTTNLQKVVRGTLSTIVTLVKESKITSPAIIVVGTTASFDFTSNEKKELAGINIGVTGTKELRDKIERKLLDHGAIVEGVCKMEVVKTPYMRELETEISNIQNYDWVVFTSQNAIKFFFSAVKNRGIDQRKLHHLKFAVIGQGTKEALFEFGYVADFMPEQFTSIHLASELVKQIKENEKLLIPRAKKGSEDFTNILANHQINYKEIPIYDINGTLLFDRKKFFELDYLLFLSASGVESFFEGLKENQMVLPEDVKIACIGEMTATEVNKYGRVVNIISTRSDVDGLVASIIKDKSDMNNR